MVTNTGNPITVPVGKATWPHHGRAGQRPSTSAVPWIRTLTASIHRKVPCYDELSPSQELLETGIKVIDLVPVRQGR